MEISKQEAQDLVFEGSGDTYEVLKTQLRDTSRWSTNKTVIFRRKADGVLFGADFSVGATEYQDEQPFQYEDPVKCYEVEEVLTPTYVRKS
jgi:hypothetical protein